MKDKEQTPEGIEEIIGKCWEKTNRELIHWVNPTPYRIGFLDAISWQAKQSNQLDGWLTGKPEFTKDCILLTATEIRGKWEYNSCMIIKIDSEDDNGNEVWYWGWCNMDGEEYGDIADMSADKYKIISLIKQTNEKTT